MPKLLCWGGGVGVAAKLAGHSCDGSFTEADGLDLLLLAQIFSELAHVLQPVSVLHEIGTKAEEDLRMTLLGDGLGLHESPHKNRSVNQERVKERDQVVGVLRVVEVP